MKLSDLDPGSIEVVSEPKARKSQKLSELNSDDFEVVKPGKEPGLIAKAASYVGEKGLGALEYAGEKLDRYVDAPFRTMVDDYQENLSEPGSLYRGNPIPSLVKGAMTIGSDPRKAPTMDRILSRNPLIGPVYNSEGARKTFAKGLLLGGKDASDRKYERVALENQTPRIDPRLDDAGIDEQSEKMKDIALPIAMQTAASFAQPSNVVGAGEAKTILGGGKGALVKTADKLGELHNAATAEALAEEAALASKAAKKVVDNASASPNASNPMSIKDVSDRVTVAKSLGELTDPPKLEVVTRAKAKVGNLKYPVLPIQEKALGDIDVENFYKTLKETGGKKGQNIVDYERLQRQELTKKLQDTISDLHPEKLVETDPVKSGKQLSDGFVEQYKTAKKTIGKQIGKFDNVRVGEKDHAKSLANQMFLEFPELQTFALVGDDGRVGLKGYSRSSGLSKQEYQTVKEVMEDLQSRPLSIKEIRNMRGSILSEFPDFMSRPPAIEKLRRVMLNHIQDLVVGKNPGMEGEVVNTFRKYAINERKLDEMEKVLGGSLSQFASGTKVVNDERALNRIFSSTRNIKVAQGALSPEAYQSALSNYLASNVGKFTKDGAVSSRQLSNWLGRNKALLQVAAQQSPQAIEQIESITDLLRIIPDTASGNPSGTAKTLLTAIKGDSGFTVNPNKLLDRGVGFLKEKAKESSNAKKFESINQNTKPVGMLNKIVGPGNGALLRKFIRDEGGSFDPKQLKGLLKPGEENVFDLKKAREVVGEPKGLLPGEGGAPAAKYRPPLSKEERSDLLNWIDSAYNTLRRGERFSPVDEKYLREVLPVAPDYQKKYVKDLLEQIEKQKTGLNTGEQIVADRAKSAGASGQFKPGQKITAEDGRDFEIIDVNPKTGMIMMKTPDGGTSFDYADNIASFLDEMKQEPKGLLTSLNIEKKKGPRKELAEPGKVVAEVRPTNSGMRVDRPGDVKPQKLTDEELARRQKEFYYQEKDAATKRQADELAKEAAEAERMKKGLLSLDVPKAKKPKVTGPQKGETYSGPSGKKYKVLDTEIEDGKTYVKVEHMDVSGGPNDGKMITTWEDANDSKIFYGKERGESGPPGKKELVDSLMSGKKKVPGIKPITPKKPKK